MVSSNRTGILVLDGDNTVRTLGHPWRCGGDGKRDLGLDRDPNRLGFRGYRISIAVLVGHGDINRIGLILCIAGSGDLIPAKNRLIPREVPDKNAAVDRYNRAVPVLQYLYYRLP